MMLRKLILLIQFSSTVSSSKSPVPKPNRGRLFTWLRQLRQTNPFTITRWVVLWAAIGICSGIVAGIYWIVLEQFTHVLRTFDGANLLWVMPLAGLIIGLVIHFLGHPGEIALIVDNIHLRGGRIDARENPSMLLSSLVSISAGGSLGPEAPMVQVTGSLGTWFADRLNLRGEDLRTLSLAGMAAGFTALFGAPLGGAFFALEILHHQHVVEYYEAILPAIVSSCASYVVFILITKLGVGPIWDFPSYQVDQINDFTPALLCGLIGAIAGWLFIYILRACKRLFARVPGPIYLHTTLGGFILGLLALFFPLTRYFGHDELNEVIIGSFTISALLALAIAKMVAIGVTVSGEWRGGFIIPLFFTGACLGKALALVVPIHPVLAMISVMAAMNATATRTPISTTLLLSKLTGFSSFTPILFASLIGFFLAPKVPLIASQLKSQQERVEAS
jgi:H+/Cl- antiporter ClcA